MFKYKKPDWKVSDKIVPSPLEVPFTETHPFETTPSGYYFMPSGYVTDSELQRRAGMANNSISGGYKI